MKGNKSNSLPKKVALVHDCTDYGGLEKYIIMLGNNLDRSRYEPVVVVPGFTDSFKSSPQRFIDEVKDAGLTLLRPSDPGNNRLLSTIKEIYNLSNLFKKAQIDLVNIHTRWPHGGLKPVIAAQLAGIRSIIRTEHVTPSANIKSKTKYIIKPLDIATKYIMTVSESNREEQIRFLNRNPEKLVRIHSGIELEKFDPKHNVRAAKVRLGLDPDIPTVGVLGRLSEEKGQIYLIEAIPAILKALGEVNFMLVGKGDTEQLLKDKVKDLNLQKYVNFYGFQENPIQFVEAMDITAVTSLNEAFGLVLLEYMAMAKPLLVTDVPSFKEIIKNEESAIIVPCKSVEGLAQGLIRLISDKALAKRLAQNGYEKVHRDFSIQLMVENIMDLYDKALGINTRYTVEKKDLLVTNR
jgi:glycosyltransferase involved in cell wall biosynthesis